MDNKIILLKHVSFIQDKHDEFARITGEKFNIFSIMNMETDEVKTHSAIIAELLNPAGSHGQGSVFLDLFIEHLKNKFNTPSNQHIKLDSFGKLVNERICERTISLNNNWADVTGGRIDIILEDEKQICIIETKINAEDQDYQLIRYHNYAKNRGKRFYIFYLTKEGKLLSNETEYPHNDYLEDKSLAAVNVEGYNFHYENKQDYKSHLESNRSKAHIHQCLYYPISFEKDIKQWLEKCLEKTVSLPIIRETLLQYLNLINKITNQSTNNKMSKEIVESMKTNIISSFEISRNIEALKSELYNEFIEHLKAYATKNEMTYNENWKNKSSEFGLFFKPKSWEDNHLQICVIFDSKNYMGLYVGISYLPALNTTDKIKVRTKFKENGFKENDWWIWKYTENKDWADNAETWKSVATGQESKEYLEVINIINEILRVQSF
ncbi:PD-(D/E)XK nuclease family protein [Flavobacterium sp. GP15]|uniref:PDDEXK-like family protein n=1 Tax=Flavobacterium sp. GP15 TaxID=2758567 RepID=UPI00165DE277|nr:PD-(D/E)XK nuclease family protein [Flavobacterium sp. GP15]